jgi:hypothetical protein
MFESNWEYVTTMIIGYYDLNFFIKRVFCKIDCFLHNYFQVQ